MKNLLMALILAALAIPFTTACQSRTIVEERDGGRERGDRVREETTVREHDAGDRIVIEREHERPRD